METGEALIWRRATTAIAGALAVGCTVPRSPAALPESKPFVAVLSGEMPKPISRVARHAWIVMRVPGQRDLLRWEYLGGPHRRTTDDPYAFSMQRGSKVLLHDVLELDDERAHALVKCLDESVRTYEREHPSYLPIPGPNSNTFVAMALRACDVHIELPVTAVGRDYLGPVGVARTEGGTGVQLETWPLGVRLGLLEGVEVHFVGLGVGAHVWPPAITVPVNPGRIGFTFDRPAPRKAVDDDHELGHDNDERIRTMAGSAWMYSAASVVQHPSRAGGLLGRGAVGLMSRGLYGESIGYAFGHDLELGVGAPLGFAFGGHFYPIGIGYALGHTGSIAIYGGAGTSFVTARVPATLELPIDARIEADVGNLGRIGLRAMVTILTNPSERAVTSGLSDYRSAELTLATLARFGRPCRCEPFRFTDGWFFALERRELMGSAWLGASFGLEIDAEGRRWPGER